MDLVTDKCIEDETELNYYFEETGRTEWEIQNYTNLQRKGCRWHRKDTKTQVKNKPLETDGDIDVPLKIFFVNLSSYS